MYIYYWEIFCCGVLRIIMGVSKGIKSFLWIQLKEKQEKTHEAQQRARSQKQLEMAKQANIEKLVRKNIQTCLCCKYM